MAEQTKGTILSGMRPTGPLHLGNLAGALANWVALQEDYHCYYEIADLHALTDRTDTSAIRGDRLEILLDWLAAGLDPERSVLFVQSEVPEHALLDTLLGMFVPVSWLERVPTYKEKVRELGLDESASFGLLGYPVLQAVDIMIYRATAVPVGEDQLPHLELTREIARRFNHLFGEVFLEPQALLTETPRLPGLDGRKMSKSYENAVYLKDSAAEVEKKVQTMFTDPKRVYRRDPGHPDECNVYLYRRVFDAVNADEVYEDCQAAGIGCTDCKLALARAINEHLEPLRERRVALASQPDRLHEVLDDGARRARETAGRTYQAAYEAVQLSRRK
ncbi:MAG: tryptophan--tRNA ligase [Candidatus Coatesbacteria bacterium]|nr:MAG: tryptophan--tRNA ligase [Candidatus Coatesbacteria bacterium]